MAKLEILRYPDPRLRTRAQALTEVTDATRRLIDDMLETMYEAPGIGLAATQVDVHQRVVVIDLSEDRNEPRVFINPRLLAAEGEQETTEGCLSIPEYFDTVRRAERVTVDALDRWGDSFALEADGLLAVCLQHEIDHLNGKLFIDYLSALKRNRLRRRFDKQARQDSTDGFSTEQVL